LEKKSQNEDLVRTIVSTASTYLFEGIFGKINDELRLILGDIEKKGYQIEESMLGKFRAEFKLVLVDFEKKAYQMQERMLERIFSFLTLVLASLFIVLGVYSFMVEYLGLTNAAAYIVVGVALLVAYFLMNKRQRFGKVIEED
jgi:membrane-bound ClpP family serine protease